MKPSNNITSSVYEIKINGKWAKVRATSMMALNTYCESLGIKAWRMVGMMSIAEMRESQSLEVVA